MIPPSLTRRVVLRRVATFASAVAALAIAFACREPTAPLRTDPEVVGPAGARRAVAVLPDSMRSWTFVNDQQNTACADTTLCRLVDGPAGSPLGSGSAELATNAASDGYALVLPGFGGTRLDHVTALGYSTYRQSADAGNNLAIALQLNVDYDLADASAGWQGRIVYEPYQGAGGNVPQNSWQAWDAKAGRWWGTKATVPRNGVNVANPCVQATPCTWSQLLAAFPNAGVSVAYGAVVLKAGSGWVGFRGNVDALTIEVDGLATSYDFERAAAAPGAGFRLQTSMQDGATPASWNLDTTYASGASVTYAFASRPGRAEVIVVLDDTLVPASGQFLMTRDRKLQIFSDTLYTYETLQPLERAIADLERAMLFGADKQGAQEAATRFFTTELANGTDPAALARATEVAQYVASDPIADSTAIRATDDALTTFDVFVNIYPDPTTPFDVWTEKAEDFGPIFPDGPLTQRTSSTSPRLSAASRRDARMTAAGVKLPGTSSPRRQLAPTARTSDISDFVLFPPEQLYVIYTNGILTTRTAAALSVTLMGNRLRQEERFNNWWTTFELHHNRTQTEEVEARRRNDPCAVKVETGISVFSKEQMTRLYARCRGTDASWGKYVTDLNEMLSQRAELMAGMMPSNPDALRLTRVIATRRNAGNGHVIAVGHSEGTILVAQAIKALPTLEPHAVNFANRCVAAMALAPLAPLDAFGLDQNHVKGLLANGDLATDLAGGGWRAFDAKFSEAYRQAAAILRPWIAAQIHFVNVNYLVGTGGDLFATEMMGLHRECLPRRATLNLSTSLAAPGSTLSAHVEVFNQNERELFGREVGIGGNVRRVQPLVTNTSTSVVQAWYPSDDPGKAVAQVTQFIYAQAPLTVDVFSIPLSVTSQTTRSWVFFAGANAPTGPTTFHPPPPSTPPGSCSDHVLFTDTDGAWWEYSTYCETAYTLVFDRLTEIPGGLSVDDIRVTMPTAPGEPGTHRFDNVCTDSKLCILSAKVEFFHKAYDDQGQMRWDLIGRSAVVPIS